MDFKLNLWHKRDYVTKHDKITKLDVTLQKSTHFKNNHLKLRAETTAGRSLAPQVSFVLVTLFDNNAGSSRGLASLVNQLAVFLVCERVRTVICNHLIQ